MVRAFILRFIYSISLFVERKCHVKLYIRLLKMLLNLMLIVLNNCNCLCPHHKLESLGVNWHAKYRCGGDIVNNLGLLIIA